MAAFSWWLLYWAVGTGVCEHMKGTSGGLSSPLLTPASAPQSTGHTTSLERDGEWKGVTANVIPINTSSTIWLRAKKLEKEPIHFAHRKSLWFLSTELLPTFPQAEATFPAQTQRHGQASELPFLTQRNARQATSPGAAQTLRVTSGTWTLWAQDRYRMMVGGAVGWW